MLSLARDRLIVHFPYLYVKKIAAKVQHFFDIRKTLVAKNAFFYSISRARYVVWSRKMHFFIRFREQGRATAHDFVVAHVEKKQYLCIKISMNYGK